MTPFPECEDMTVKRLYVALKRGDERLLRMGAQKLQEKYYSGFQFTLLDDLRDILNRLNEQNVFHEIKEPLQKTITNILNGVRPEYPITEENSQTTLQIASETGAIQTPLGVINSTPQAMEALKAPSEISYQNTSFSTENEGYKPMQNETPVLNIPQENIEKQTSVNQTVNEPQTYQAPNYQEQYKEQQQPQPQTLTPKDIVVFYDDKAGFIDYDKNKTYRFDITQMEMNRESSPITNAVSVKNSVDTGVDEIADVFYALKNLTGKISLISTSKSANILNMLDEFQIKFNIPSIENYTDAKAYVYPLFGLSNIYYCPKCGKREYFIDKENKVISLQCSNCASAMYPDVFEAKDYETTTYPNNWIKSFGAMSKSDTWVLINPPLESSRALACEFLRTAFTSLCPKKVLIVTKDSAIKEYYRQMLREIVQGCEIKTEFANTDTLLAEITRERTQLTV